MLNENGLVLALRGPSHSFSAPTQFLLSLLFPILTDGPVPVERTTCVKLRPFNAIPRVSAHSAKSFRNNTYRILPPKSLRMNTYTKKAGGGAFTTMLSRSVPPPGRIAVARCGLPEGHRNMSAAFQQPFLLVRTARTQSPRAFPPTVNCERKTDDFLP